MHRSLGIDYEEMFSPIAKWATIRTLLSLAAQKGWKVHQKDVNIQKRPQLALRKPWTF